MYNLVALSSDLGAFSVVVVCRFTLFRRMPSFYESLLFLCYVCQHLDLWIPVLYVIIIHNYIIWFAPSSDLKAFSAMVVEWKDDIRQKRVTGHFHTFCRMPSFHSPSTATLLMAARPLLSVSRPLFSSSFFLLFFSFFFSEAFFYFHLNEGLTKDQGPYVF